MDFKVRCIESASGDFTKGEVYDVKSGKIFDNVSYSRGKFTDVNNINHSLNSKFELVEEPKQFTKADLRTGMILEDRDGNKKIVLLNTAAGDIYRYISDGDRLISNWGDIKNYNDDLTFNGGCREFDTMKVYGGNNIYIGMTNQQLIWERKSKLHITTSIAIKELSELHKQDVEIVED